MFRRLVGADTRGAGAEVDQRARRAEAARSKLVEIVRGIDT
jgi:hypothetical protein